MTNKTNSELNYALRDPISTDGLYLTTMKLSVLRWITAQIDDSKVGVFRIGFWRKYD